MQDHFRSVTGLPVSTYFSAYKFRWLLENVPEVREATKRGSCVVGTVDTWIIWNLTGGTNGRNSMIHEVQTTRWMIMYKEELPILKFVSALQ